MIISIACVRKGKTMDDVISRRDAIDATWRETGYADPINVATAIRDRIEALPSAERKGEWLDGYSRQTCSVCRYRGFKSWNYCPNCGADMRGERDDT